MNVDSPREVLAGLRKKLLTLHRELIDSERVVYERSAGTIPSAGAFLQLLAHDAWFEWLQPFSQLITRMDEALADKENPVISETATAFLRETQELLQPAAQGDGFSKFYAQAIQRDPHVLLAHGEVMRRIKSA